MLNGGWGGIISYVMPVERLTPASNADTANIWISKEVDICCGGVGVYSGGHRKCSGQAGRAGSNA